MPHAHGTRGLAGTAPKLAIVAAIVALVMSSLAVFVVVSRDGGAAPVAAGSAPAAVARSTAAGSAAGAAGSGTAGKGGRGGEPALPPVQRVAAADVVRLRREVVAQVRDAGQPLGVRVTDEALRRALDLGAGDVITAIAGRPIERELDVFEAMLSVKSLRASILYIDLLRDGQPVLARWKVDGDLRAARAPDPYDAFGTAGILGGSSGLGGLGGSPYLPVPVDPLIDTIKRVDDLHYEVPRATIDRVLAARSAYAGIARALPSRRTAGVQLFGIRPGSLLAAAGIANGDIVRAINANAVTAVDEVLDLLPQIRGDREWRIDLDRRGKPVLITIALK